MHAESDGDCKSGGAGPLREVDAFDFRPCEVEWLHIFRTMLSRQADPTDAAWRDIHARAASWFGDHAAPLILGATTGLIRALKAERPHLFYFVSPDCAHCRESLCEDEFMVMCAVVSARCGDHEQLQLAVGRLTEGAEAGRLLQAAQSLAVLMNTVFGRQSSQLRAPMGGRILH